MRYRRVESEVFKYLSAIPMSMRDYVCSGPPVQKFRISTLYRVLDWFSVLLESPLVLVPRGCVRSA